MAVCRTVALEAARDMLGLTVIEVWIDYMGLGGSLSPAAIEAALSGRGRLDDHNYDVLALTLNEQFSDRDDNHPLQYADELPLVP